jgi:hypothetical protein
MWTRLVAGVAAHDINNVAQGLANLLALAARPGASRESLERYATLARDGLTDLRRLAGTLGAVAESGTGESTSLRLDLLCTDAVTETVVPEGRSVELGTLPKDVFVKGSPAGPRLIVSLVLRYSLAASAFDATVRVGAPSGEAAGTVVIDAPLAPSLPMSVDTPLAELVGRPERALGGDGALILAGAIAAGSGAQILVASPGGKGLRFKLRFPRAEKGTEHARSA